MAPAAKLRKYGSAARIVSTAPMGSTTPESTPPKNALPLLSPSARSGDFKEVYHGIEDIPAEHRIFAYPKLNIREQMAAYKEVIDRSSLEGERLHPRKEHDDR